jgi:probable rRNA maturation factor
MILNRQRGVRIPVRVLNEFFVEMCRTLRLSPEALSICLVTNNQITAWNKAYRGKSGPTDVLSFGVQEDKGVTPRTGVTKENRAKRGRRVKPVSTARYLGDIAIAPAVAKRNAVRFGRTFDEEIRVLMLHGALHLMGYDHETDSGEMDRRERRMRRELGLAGVTA